MKKLEEKRFRVTRHSEIPAQSSHRRDYGEKCLDVMKGNKEFSRFCAAAAAAGNVHNKFTSDEIARGDLCIRGVRGGTLAPARMQTSTRGSDERMLQVIDSRSDTTI